MFMSLEKVYSIYEEDFGAYKNNVKYTTSKTFIKSYVRELMKKREGCLTNKEFKLCIEELKADVGDLINIYYEANPLIAYSFKESYRNTEYYLVLIYEKIKDEFDEGEESIIFRKTVVEEIEIIRS